MNVCNVFAVDTYIAPGVQKLLQQIKSKKKICITLPIYDIYRTK